MKRLTETLKILAALLFVGLLAGWLCLPIVAVLYGDYSVPPARSWRP